MDRSLYIVANGAKQLLQAKALSTHNLANATTTGFQADLAAMRSQPVFGNGMPSRVYSMTENPGVDFSKGSILSTGRELDVAINGQGWLAVQAPDGSEAYTRAGDLRVSPTGLLETGAGHPVLGDGGPILIPDSQKLEIAADGTISVLPKGQAATAMAQVGRIKLVAPDPATLEKGTDGLLRVRDGAPAVADPSVQVVAGALESSNVNAVHEMVTMIELARQFETQIKMLKTAEDNDAAAAKLMSIS